MSDIHLFIENEDKGVNKVICWKVDKRKGLETGGKGV